MRGPLRSELAGDLFEVMTTGGRVGFETVAWFNGGLFDDSTVLPLEKSNIETVLAASDLDWSEIDPSILGTLFERGLDPGKRAQLGAHYTDRDKIMLLVEPVVIRPLLVEWEAEKTAITAELERGRAVDAGIGPAPLPAVQIPLAVVEALEAEAAQRRFLGVAEGLSRSLLNFGWRTPGLLYEVIYVTPRQQPRRRAEPARPGHRPGAADRGSPGPAGSASPPPPARSPPSVESSGHHASA